MTWLEAAYWGAFGGFAIEVFDYMRATRWHRKKPWLVASTSLGAEASARADVRPGEESLPAPGKGAYLLGSVFRIIVGGGVAGAIAASAPSVSPWVALIVGSAAMPLLERVLSLVPLLAQVGKDAVHGVIEQQQARQQAAGLQQGPTPAPAVQAPTQSGTMPAGAGQQPADPAGGAL